MADITEKQIQQYLNRIGYKGTLNPTLENLTEIHRCHMSAVPFENLSVYHKEQIQLNWCWLFDKVVHRRRGGFCFELNGLFSFLLDYLGFSHTKHAARVFNRRTGVLGPELDHLVLTVKIGPNYFLVDVGFGDSFITPLRFVQDEEQETESGIYCIRKYGSECYALEEKFKTNVRESTELTCNRFPDENYPAEWEKRYSFDLNPISLEKCHNMCVYHQRSPESPFTHNRICTVARPWGRVTLAHEKVVTTTYLGGNAVRKEEKKLNGEEEVLRTLEEQFGIIM